MSGSNNPAPHLMQLRTQAKPPPLPQRASSCSGARTVSRQLSVQLGRGGGPFRRTHGTLREAADDSQGGFLALRVIRELANSAAMWVAAGCASDRDSGFATVNEDSGGIYESLSASWHEDDAIRSSTEDDFERTGAGESRPIVRWGSVSVALDNRQPRGGGGPQKPENCRYQRRSSVTDGSLSRPAPKLQPKALARMPPPPPPRRRQSAGPVASSTASATADPSASAVAMIRAEPPKPAGPASDSTIPRAAYAEQIRQAQRRLQPQQKQPSASSRHNSISMGASRPPELPPRKSRSGSASQFHQDSYIMNRSGFARSDSGGQFNRQRQDRSSAELASGVSGFTGAQQPSHLRLVSSPSLPVPLQHPRHYQQPMQHQEPDAAFERLSLEFNAELKEAPKIVSDCAESPASPISPFASLSRPFPELAEPEIAAPLDCEQVDVAEEDKLEEEDGTDDEMLPLAPYDSEEPHDEPVSLERLRTTLGDLRRRLSEAEASLLGEWRRLVMERCQTTGALECYDRYLSRLGPLARLRCQLDRRQRRLQQQQQELNAGALPAQQEELQQRGRELEKQLQEARNLAESAGRNRRRLLGELRKRLAPGELQRLREAVQHRMRLAEQAEATRMKVLCAQEHHSLGCC